MAKNAIMKKLAKSAEMKERFIELFPKM